MNIPANHNKTWRRRAGNVFMYDTLGVSQLSLMTLFFGLRETHKLLEIGSGPMRAGRFFIMYLNEGNYFGVEPNTQSTELGLKHEVGDELCGLRQPKIVDRSDYCFHELGEEFDYALSYSVITHCPPKDVSKIFTNLSKCFHENSIFLGTADFTDDEEVIVDEDNWTVLPTNRYSFERIENEASRVGMKVQRFGRVFQEWFCVYYEGNEIARRGIEQASSVNWQQVLPKWVSPPAWKSAKEKPVILKFPEESPKESTSENSESQRAA